MIKFIDDKKWAESKAKFTLATIHTKIYLLKSKKNMIYLLFRDMHFKFGS